MVADEIELTDRDIIVIVDESDEHRPSLPRYEPDPEYGSDPQWRAPDGYDTDWSDGEPTQPLKEIR